ncbi:MAG: multicopper oxidase domain-containing protein [Methylococcaceae bacterium]|nr:multicopper oxidase domain-containing protein [Methylococcaceae bacterium]
MSPKKIRLFASLLLLLLVPLAIWLKPDFINSSTAIVPATNLAPKTTTQTVQEAPCKNEHPDWRKAQEIDGVKIAESVLCDPDNPYDIAFAAKGANHVSMKTLMSTHFAQDALTLGEDLDGDGDPDIINIKLEVIELNGFSPDGEFLAFTYNTAPGIQPGLWVFAPKTSDMATKNFRSKEALYMLRAPSPVLRVEQGDKVFVTLENTHYFPHTIHFHGVDHPFQTAAGEDNDGTDHAPVFPGDSKTYEFQPRHTGTMLYHCHVQTDKHMMMGLGGMIVIEENRPNNWVQTFNIGAGQVRHASVASAEKYDQEYDLHYQSVDNQMAGIIQQYNDPRLINKQMHRVYDINQSHEDQYLLNGHAFPYTMRDAMIVAKPNQNIKLRIANMQNSPIAVHIHGHKATITDYDGVERPEAQQITRDVFDVAPAQRIDLSLQTVNDGLHSYGEGLWMFHDHIENGITTNGMSPGGNMALLAYQSFLDDKGMPKGHSGMDEYFSPAYYAKEKPLWAEGDFAQLLGDADVLVPDTLRLIAFGLVVGLLLGLLLFLIRGSKKAG